MDSFIYQPPMEPYLSIVYQDDHLLVLDKPAGLLSVPGRRQEHQDSLALRVQRVFPTARVVHRLDMATSGLLLMALHADAQRHLNQQFEQRTVAKTYLAEVMGHPAVNSGHIDKPLRCDWPNRPRQMVDWQAGKPSLTHWSCLERRTTTSLLSLTPKTGRSHQLRVHLASEGMAIVGDQLYAPAPWSHHPRLHLHASQLSFCHPYHQHQLTFDSDCTFADATTSTCTSGDV